jgi:hypothetical protein
MATLAGSTIASTYTYLLKMDGTSGLTGSLVAIQDGDATDSAVKISTKAMSVTGTLSSDTQTTPETILTLGATYASTGTDGGAGSGSRIEFQIPDDETNPITGAAIAGIKEAADDSDASAGMAFYISQNDTTLDEAVRIDHDGKVGIGTASPTSILDVEATSGASLLYEDSGEGLLSLITSGGTAVVRLDARSGEDHYLNNGGSLGILTASPNVGSANAERGVITISSTDNAGANNYAVLEVQGHSINSDGALGVVSFLDHSTNVASIQVNTDDGSQSSGKILFLTKAAGGSITERMRLASDGVLDLKTGQLKFPASENASSDANTLDDYQEGIHTTAITGADSGTFTIDSANQSLGYTKIGRMVTVQGKFQTSSGSGSGDLRISMPFTSNNSLDDSADVSAGSITVNRYGSTSIATQITPIIFANTAYVLIQIHNTGNANETYLQADNVDATIEGQICISYIV